MTILKVFKGQNVNKLVENYLFLRKLIFLIVLISLLWSPLLIADNASFFKIFFKEVEIGFEVHKINFLYQQIQTSINLKIFFNRGNAKIVIEKDSNIFETKGGKPISFSINSIELGQKARVEGFVDGNFLIIIEKTEHGKSRKKIHLKKIFYWSKE